MGIQWGGGAPVTLPAFLAPLQGAVLMRFTLQRYKDPAIEFDGEIIAEVSSRQPGAPRWQEIRIYKTRAGTYVTEVVGRTTVPGEGDIVNVREYKDPARVIEGLYRKRRRQSWQASDAPRKRYLTLEAYEALALAHEKDPAIPAAVASDS